ncbi:MAG: class I SAM-dependent methyltransferase [Ignavibacteriaceae bacterium]
MAEFILTPGSIKDGIYFLSEINNEFESIYLKVRAKENRIYSADELEILPFASDSNPHKKEWNLRAKSFLRFKKYLKEKKGNLNVLDLGCGNGWLSGQLAKMFTHNFYCIDVNFAELKQGKNTFKSDQIKFVYADIFTSEIPNSTFDIVILNASTQYFPDLKRLIHKLLAVIKNRGEIHIFDSPIYSETEVESAKQRTKDYYSSMSFSGMTNYYHHHIWKELSGFNYKVLYNPLSFINKFNKLIINDSPFPWIRLLK